MSHPYIAVISSVIKEIHDQLRYGHYRGALRSIKSLFGLLKPEDKEGNRELYEEILELQTSYNNPPQGVSTMPMVTQRHLLQLDSANEDLIHEVFNKVVDVLHEGKYLDNSMYEAEGREVFKQDGREWVQH